MQWQNFHLIRRLDSSQTVAILFDFVYFLPEPHKAYKLVSMANGYQKAN